jgi:hypothetical protein
LKKRVKEGILAKKKIPIAGLWWLTPVKLAAQKDHSSKPAWANSSCNPISKKKKSQKRAVELA